MYRLDVVDVVRIDRHRALDRRRDRGPACRTSSSRTADLWAKFVGRAEGVPRVGVLGDEPQRDLLTAATDQDRQVARPAAG